MKKDQIGLAFQARLDRGDAFVSTVVHESFLSARIENGCHMAPERAARWSSVTERA
jgi:hypothetical protein